MTSEYRVASVGELAAQLISSQLDDLDEVHHPATAGAVAVERLSAELCRWVGAEGCRVLLSRALTRAQRDRPVLADLRVGSESPPVLEGVEESLEAHGPAAVALGIEDTMISVLDLLSRLIGHELTIRLAERSMNTRRAPYHFPHEKGAPPQ